MHMDVNEARQNQISFDIVDTIPFRKMRVSRNRDNNTIVNSQASIN